MLHFRFIIREVILARKQALVFVLCTALSLTTLVALDIFKNEVNRAILADARALHGGDIIIHSHAEFTSVLRQAIADFERQRVATGIRTYEFYSVAQTLDTHGSLLAKIKIVEPGYPLYGRVRLQSGRQFGTVLGPGRIIVAQEVLDRLRVHVGDQLRLGARVLTIADVITHEPDRPVNLFALGPRIFVADADRGQLDLIQKGSRIEYQTLLKVFDRTNTPRVTARLSDAARAGQERVDTFRTAQSDVKRFFDNFLFFLSLISIFTLLLAGIGMQSSLAAMLREKGKTFAIAKALGATNSFLRLHYLIMVVGLGLAGSGLGILAGTLLAHFLPHLFAGFIPVNSLPSTTVRAGATGLLLGLLVVLLFTFLPLSRVGNVKPVALFRNENTTSVVGVSYYLALVCGLLLLTALVVRQLQDVEIGLSFMAGTLLLIVIIGVIIRIFLAVGARISIPSLPLRQAFRSLYRPGNATRSIIITLAAALAVLLSIHLVEYNLQAAYIASYPADAPNLFCLDIQPDQREPFARLVDGAAQFYPIVRARLISINGVAINRQQELRKRRDNLSRGFNLTYRDTLLADEKLLAGKSLFPRNRQDEETVPVSILDMVADMGDMQLGDLLVFNIQGVPLTARVASIRTRTRSRLYPFFYFVFPERVLHEAPHTFFATLHLEKGVIPQLVNRVVGRFPNISVINMTETVTVVGDILARLTKIINFFAAFSILAGGLIIVSSVFATRLARIREAVYYKILGGTTAFVIAVFFYENMLLGLLSSLVGVMLAQTGSWALCHFLFDIPYRARWSVSQLLIILTTALVIAVGLLSSITIVRQKPASFLREQTEG
jgi:putative ABC transport system permease protein